MESAKNKLLIVGAGPGDPDLLTIKAYRAIKNAEVILYDNLVNRKILRLAPKKCEQIYVGKIPYQRFTHQEHIHELIEHHSRMRKRIVRLKGGDPFIFGRGFEELIFAKHLGLEVSYIPGISSMQALGMCDIPLTHRGISDGVWAITGTKSDHSLSSDIELAINSRSTLVIYMGMKKLELIEHIYRSHGRGDTPAALVQEITTPRQKAIFTTANALRETATSHAICHPALIVIGEVANLWRQALHSPALSIAT